MAAILLLWLTVGSTKASAAVSVPIDAEHFKDDTLRALVSESFDEDGDGILSEKEALRAKVLDCSGRKITSMDGIQYLSLTELYCSDCSLTELNLEGNTKLEKLDCSGNALTKLDIVPCTQLKVAYVQGNQISALEVWNATYLRATFNQGTATDQGTSILYKKLSIELCVDKAVQVISNSCYVYAKPMIRDGSYTEPGSISVGELYPEGILTRKYYGEGTTAVLTATAKEGYRFAFWGDMEGYPVSTEPTYSFVVTENVDLWAVFMPYIVSVRFLPNGGTGTMADVTLQQGEYYKLPPNNFTAPNGYYFHHWEIGEVAYQRGDQVKVLESISVRAIWKEENLKGTLKLLDDASGSVVTKVTCGMTLKATFLGDVAGTLSYQWTRNGENIAGATAQTYVLTEEDIGKTIGCWVKSSIETGSVFCERLMMDNCYYVGDEFNSQGFYFYDDCYDKVIYSERNIKLQRFERHSVDMEYWNVGNFKPSYLYLKTPKRRGLLETPVGFRIASGKGTSEDPYHLELLYENEPLAETGAVTIGTKWYRGETVTSYAYFAGVDLTKLRGRSYYLTWQLGTTSDVVGVFYHQYVNDDNIIGVEVTSGEGTEKNPYHVSPIYSQNLQIPDLSGKVWAVGDTIELGDAYYNCFLRGPKNGHFSYGEWTQTTKTGGLNGKIIGEPKIEEDSEQHTDTFYGFENIPLVAEKIWNWSYFPIGITVSDGNGYPDSPYILSIVWGVKDKVSVVLLPNGGSGTIDAMALNEGETQIILPSCTFTAPAGKEFAGWEVTNLDGQVKYENVQANETINVESNLICKAIWKEVVLHDDNLVIAKKSLTLYDTISIEFKVPETAFEGYHDPYLEATQNGKTSRIYEYRTEGGLRIFTYRVAPHVMGDAVTAVPHALNADGADVTGVAMTYSATEYCYNQLGKETYQTEQWAPFRRLLVDILLYGDAAQRFAGYKTDELPSRNLTSTQLAMGTDVSILMNYDNVRNLAFETVDDADKKAEIKTAALYLEAAVNIQFKFTADDLTGLTVVISDDTGVLEELTPNPSDKDTNGRYYVTFGNLNAGEMRKTVYATVMQGSKKVSNTMRYSVESYAAAQSNSAVANLPELLHAMMRYGDSAKAVAEMLAQ